MEVNMANLLKMAKAYAIIGFLEQHWLYGRMARELGVNRETGSRYARLRRETAVLKTAGERVSRTVACLLPDGFAGGSKDRAFP